MSKIRKDDEVIVLTGRDKGRRGSVVAKVDENFVKVDGINSVKKAVKPNPMAGTVGGIVSKLMPIHVSNVALFNPATGRADKVGFKDIGGKKVRVYKSSGEAISVKA
jgi:large subunit ribosomal protein L24